MKLGTMLYIALCGLALSYLAFANMRGYVPFASTITHAARGTSTAGHFHK
jgi:hypothetical protein